MPWWKPISDPPPDSMTPPVMISRAYHLISRITLKLSSLNQLQILTLVTTPVMSTQDCHIHLHLTCHRRSLSTIHPLTPVTLQVLIHWYYHLHLYLIYHQMSLTLLSLLSSPTSLLMGWVREPIRSPGVVKLNKKACPSGLCISVSTNVTPYAA